MHIRSRPLLTAGTLLSAVLAAKIPRQGWDNDGVLPLSQGDLPDYPPPSSPPVEGWGGQAAPQGYGPPPTPWGGPPPSGSPPPPNYDPHADQAWGIVFGRGQDASASFQPIFSPTALTFISLFDNCGQPTDKPNCHDAALCEMGIAPFCQLHGTPAKQFRQDLCNLGLAGVCRRDQVPGRTNAGTAFTWGLMVGGIQANGSNNQQSSSTSSASQPTGTGSVSKWSTVTVTTTLTTSWASTATDTDTQSAVSTSTETDVNTSTTLSVSTETNVNTSTMMITTTQVSSQTQTTSLTGTVTSTYVPVPNPTRAHIFRMGLSLQAALKCTGHEASDRCTDADICSWGFDLFCPPPAWAINNPSDNSSSNDTSAVATWGGLDIATARAHFKHHLCNEGIGMFCAGGDVNHEERFLADVMRAVARMLMHEKWGVDGDTDQWDAGHPYYWVYGTATAPSASAATTTLDNASATTSGSASAPGSATASSVAPSLRREIEAALRPKGKLWGPKGAPSAKKSATYS